VEIRCNLYLRKKRYKKALEICNYIKKSGKKRCRLCLLVDKSLCFKEITHQPLQVLDFALHVLDLELQVVVLHGQALLFSEDDFDLRFLLHAVSRGGVLVLLLLPRLLVDGRGTRIGLGPFARLLRRSGDAVVVLHRLGHPFGVVGGAVPKVTAAAAVGRRGTAAAPLHVFDAGPHQLVDHGQFVGDIRLGRHGGGILRGDGRRGAICKYVG
jgi:hypothetical protein